MLLSSLVAISAYLVIDGRWYGVDPSSPMVYDPGTRSLFVDTATARGCAPLGGATQGVAAGQALFYGPSLVQVGLDGGLSIVRKHYLAVHMHTPTGDLRCAGEKSGEPIFRGHFEA